MNDQTNLDKLFEERDKLGGKMGCLSNFLADEDNLSSVSPVQRELLFLQRDAMVMYHSILTRRIQNLRSEEEE